MAGENISPSVAPAVTDGERVMPLPASTPAQMPLAAPAAPLKIEPVKGSVAREKKGSVNPAEKGSGSGSRKKGSGSGYQLPDLDGVQWMKNKKGGLEAWHLPDGIGPRSPRSKKLYLGHIGKRQLAAWSKIAPAEKRAAVEDWIDERRREKGIN
jgi:hypothetical protein